ncbi:MAG: phosphatidylserine/phosphatidylglycerophosphate/cardiolipin synthase family protein [Cyclobacteriaceae bacterium]
MVSSGQYSDNNCVTFIRGGKHYFDHLLHMIDSSKDTLHLQTYIFEEDETGRMVSAALVEAVQRGVRVFLLVDGYASQSLDKDFIACLRREGLKFKLFEPLFKSRKFYLGRRLHHKLCVSDLRYALVGGVNIANHYNDLPDNPAWLDFALGVEGEIVSELFVLCQKTWNGFQPLKRIPPLRNRPVFAIQKGDRSAVRMRRNDWVRRKQEISRSYLEMFNNANSHIILLSSYFLPGRIFRRALRRARDRGVAVTVIVAGKSDVKVSKYAERFMYEWMLVRGIKIIEYNKTVLHGKLAICDDEWITLGSFNVNDISAYASVELNLDVKDVTLVREIREEVESLLANNSQVIDKSYMASHTTLFARFLQWSAFMSIRILFYFFTFYFKQVEKTE